MAASSSIPVMESEGENIVFPNWLELPTDVTANILQRLGTVEIVTNACQVCPLWRNIFKNPLMWRTINMSCTYLQSCNLDISKICSFAVEKSCGYLEDITIDSVGTNVLVHFIAANASNLLCLRLSNCLTILDTRFMEAVKKLPMLEEVDISFCPCITKDSLEVLGRSCPRLKSLKYVKRWNEPLGSNVDDVEAFVIAETMLGLSHLFIEGIDLTSVGLLAILDGCPLLESLDIKGCFHLSLNESLKKRCYDQIKDLKLPIMTNFGDYYYDGQFSHIISQIPDNTIVRHFFPLEDDYFEDDDDFY